MSVLRGTQYTLESPVFVGSDGETPEDCASLPTATVTRDDGTSLTAATVTNTSENGKYTAAITTTHTARLDLLRIQWTGTSGSQVQVYDQTLEVAGGWYVTIPEIRGEQDMSSTTKYPVAELRRRRDEFEAIAEEYCGVAFVPRYATITVRGNGARSILLPHSRLLDVLSVTIDGTAKDATDYELDEDFGIVAKDGSTFTRPSSTSGRNVTVTYTHGYKSCPPEMRRACLTWMASKLTTQASGLSTAAATEVVDGGRQMTFSTASASDRRPTGIDSVDAVLNRLDETVPAVA